MGNIINNSNQLHLHGLCDYLMSTIFIFNDFRLERGTIIGYFFNDFRLKGVDRELLNFQHGKNIFRESTPLKMKMIELFFILLKLKK